MSTLLYPQSGPVPSTEAEVRTTITTVDDADPAAVSDHTPDFNEHETDPDTLGGITTRQLASHVIPSERYVPNVDASASSEHSEIVNRQVSTSGTAAAKEAAGQWGHGTFKVVEGIEPTIRDGSALGSDYFSAGAHDVGTTSAPYMTPSQTADPTTRGDAVATAQIAAHRAAKASMYAAYLEQQTGN